MTTLTTRKPVCTSKPTLKSEMWSERLWCVLLDLQFPRVKECSKWQLLDHGQIEMHFVVPRVKECSKWQLLDHGQIEVHFVVTRDCVVSAGRILNLLGRPLCTFITHPMDVHVPVGGTVTLELNWSLIRLDGASNIK